MATAMPAVLRASWRPRSSWPDPLGSLGAHLDQDSPSPPPFRTPEMPGVDRGPWRLCTIAPLSAPEPVISVSRSRRKPVAQLALSAIGVPNPPPGSR